MYEFCRQHKILTSGVFTQREKHGLIQTTAAAFISAKITDQTSTGGHRDIEQPIVLELSATKLTLPAESPAD